MSLLSDLSTAVPGLKQEVICLDSSGDEGEPKEAPPPQLPDLRDGKLNINTLQYKTVLLFIENYWLFL